MSEKKTKEVKKSKKEENEKKAQEEFENSVILFSDEGYCPCEDEEDIEDDDLEILDAIDYSGLSLVIVKSNDRYQVNLVYEDGEFNALAPKSDSYPSYIGGGLFKIRLDAQNFFEFCCKDYEFTKFNSVRII